MATDEQPGRLWVAQAEDDTVVGSIAMQDRPGSGRLRFFVVDAVVSGRGVGQRLLDEVLEHANARGLGVLDLWTFAGLDAAAHLYRRVGFELVEERMGET